MNRLSMTPASQLDFIKRIAPLAQQSQATYKIPASVVIAQAIDESGWGGSRLCGPPYNNYFGIKDVDHKNYVQFKTRENFSDAVLARFETFADPQACFDAHARLLTRGRYLPAFNQRFEPNAFALAIERCGYSTDKNPPPPEGDGKPCYANKLIELIEGHDLNTFNLKEAA